MLGVEGGCPISTPSMVGAGVCCCFYGDRIKNLLIIEGATDVVEHTDNGYMGGGRSGYGG